VNKRISKYGVMFLLMLIISMFSSTTTLANTTVKAKYSQSNLYFDGDFIWCSAFNISGNTYCKLINLSESLSGTTSQFSVVWDKDKNVKITTGKKYVPLKNQNSSYYFADKYYDAKPITKKIYVNGKLSDMKGYTIDGSDYFRLKDLSKVISFDLELTSDKKKILLYSQTPKYSYRVKTAYETIPNATSSYFPRWRNTLSSYMVYNENKTISVIEANEKINIETYDDNYKLQSKKSIKYELPLFGGFYSGEKYNYIAFGQSNSEEKDDKEVIRIVRYNKDFKRIDSVSIKGGESYTTIPFDAACGRMSEKGDRLVFHTSRQRYQTEDGLNHQSQLTIIVDTSSMRVLNDLGSFQTNHVSHSFDQYVQFDGDTHVLIDHGDAYPRSVVLSKEYIDMDYSGDNVYYNSVDLFEIPGETGANCTGVSIGGFEISSDSYIVALNSIDHSLVKEYTSYNMIGLEVDQRDIIICSLPKDFTSDSEVKQITLAKYVGTNKIASIPQLVKISEDKLMVLWQEYGIKDGETGDLNYVFLDKSGKATTKIMSVENFNLSECKPMMIDNKVVWYTNEKGCRTFYTIPIE
jgi:hypothetical protein